MKWTCWIQRFVLSVAVLNSASALAAQRSARTTEGTIDSVVAFSALDGGSLDLDGSVDGVLSLSNLEMYDWATILLDVPDATFEIVGDLTLREHAAIRVPYSSFPVIGPSVTIRCGGRVSLSNTSRIAVDGFSAGGRLIVCAGDGIELGGHSRLSADGVDDESVPAPGGEVWLESAGPITLSESARMSASGPTGGSVRLISCDTSASAIDIDGMILATGDAGAGGSVEVQARQGGIRFNHDDDRPGGTLFHDGPAIIAKGSEADGVIILTAGTTVTPDSPPTFPEAIVVTDSPSSASCDDCFVENPQDCNANGVPDDQDLAGCDGDPACDDCNLNGVLDGCDIVSGDSLDVDPQDGRPDECFDFVANGCSPPSDLWSCFENWALPGELYPDDVTSAVGVHVTLGSGDFAFLDVDARIPTLRLLSGAILRVTNSGLDGDLSFSSPAKVLNRGSILVSGDRTVGSENGIPPVFTIGPDGIYAKEPNVTAAASTTTAELTVSDLILEAGNCNSPPSSGGVLELDDSMSLRTFGDVYLKGASVADCAATGNGFARGGVSPPPKLSTSGSSSTRSGGVTFARSGSSSERAAAPVGSLHLEQVVAVSIRSSVPMVLHGDFDNRSTAPELFDWVFGGLELAGPAPQRFEVAGRDIGPSFVGFHPATDSNFAMGMIRVAAGADVTFANGFRNTDGAGACDEALHVRELVFEPGSHVTIDNCRIHYVVLTNQAANVTLLGCAALTQLVPSAPSVADDACVGGSNAGGACGRHAECPGGSCQLKNRFVSFSPAFPPIGGAVPMGIKITAANFDAESLTVPAMFNGRSWWVQTPTFGVADGVLPGFNAASLGCSFSAGDVGSIPLLHVYGSPIVPASSYDVQVCTTEAGPCSAALRVDTARWGDIVPPLVQGQPTFQDVVAVVDKFLNGPGGPSKTRAKLNGQSPDPLTPISFLEVSTAVEAFRGKTFVAQFPLGPAVCP